MEEGRGASEEWNGIQEDSGRASGGPETWETVAAAWSRAPAKLEEEEDGRRTILQIQKSLGV